MSIGLAINYPEDEKNRNNNSTVVLQPNKEIKIPSKELINQDQKKILTETTQTIEPIQTENMFEQFKYLLEEKSYEEAIYLYENSANNDNIIHYKNTLYNYIENNIEHTHNMQHLIDLYRSYEYDDESVLYYQTQIDFLNRRPLKAIKSLHELKESLINKNLERAIGQSIKEYSLIYEKQLIEEKNKEALKNFYEFWMEKQPENHKVMNNLAHFYFYNKWYDNANELFTSLLDSEIYAQNAKSYLQKIQTIKERQKRFSHTIQLEKSNNHFYINATISNQQLKLLIDTGATFTLIDSNTLTYFNKDKKIQLHTANGIKEAYLDRVDSIQIEQVSLDNFEVTLSEFNDPYANGLLGMNFLKEFDFYIDQEEAVLYLK